LARRFFDSREAHMSDTPTHAQLNIISEVALSADGAARPIHILRTGTFTSGNGFTFTFERDHLETIVSNFTAGKRRRPPITERHDYGRAVGRLERVWCEGDNLYAQPKWNKAGVDLLANEVYDGFSCEVSGMGESPTLIGGSLTNYPAVDGLQTVTLEAPALHAAGGPRADMQPHTQEIPHMAEETPIMPAPAQLADASAEVQAVVSQMRAQFDAERALVLEQARAEFQRQLQAEREQYALVTYAQHVTTATFQRQHALPIEADALTAFLAGLSTAQRETAQGLFNRILDAGLVSFEEIGNGSDAPEAPSVAAQFEAAVQAKVAGGMSRYAAIQAIGKEKPELYTAYRQEGK
jgi:hypothetical protein